MAFSDRLKERRIAKGYTQVQLSKMLGLANGAVGNYEAGQNSPRAEVLYKMFAILDCDANFLLQDEMKAQEKKAPSESEVADKRCQEILVFYNSMNESGKESLYRQALMHANNSDFKLDSAEKSKKNQSCVPLTEEQNYQQRLAAVTEYKKNPQIIGGLAAFGGESEMIEVTSEEHARRKKLFDEYNPK